MKDRAHEGQSKVDPEQNLIHLNKPVTCRWDAIFSHTANDAVKREPGCGVED